jgi:prolyl-tRNA editing enzyme YbaK/EbsC (Cys-tRNA(Pro) deacylase)
MKSQFAKEELKHIKEKTKPVKYKIMPENIQPTNQVEVLKNYLESNYSTAQQFTFYEPVYYVEQACALLESTPDKFVKTVCFESKDGVFVSVIVLGSNKVDITPIQTQLNCEKLKPATKESILASTGYEVGGMPPVGFESIFFVDSAVMSKNEVFAGGGDSFTLLKITPSELIRLNSGVVLNCAK